MFDVFSPLFNPVFPKGKTFFATLKGMITIKKIHENNNKQKKGKNTIMQRD